MPKNVMKLTELKFTFNQIGGHFESVPDSDMRTEREISWYPGGTLYAYILHFASSVTIISLNGLYNI